MCAELRRGPERCEASTASAHRHLMTGRWAGHLARVIINPSNDSPLWMGTLRHREGCPSAEPEPGFGPGDCLRAEF